MDFNIDSADITALTTGITSIFEEIVDFFVVIAPVAVLVVIGWYGIRYIKYLLRGGTSPFNIHNYRFTKQDKIDLEHDIKLSEEISGEAYGFKSSQSKISPKSRKRFYEEGGQTYGL